MKVIHWNLSNLPATRKSPPYTHMDAMSKKVAALKIPPTAMFKPNTVTTLSSIAQTEKNSSSGMYSNNCFIGWFTKLIRQLFYYTGFFL